jgi:hypothetical protein
MKPVKSSSSVGNLVSSALKISFVYQQTSLVSPSSRPEPFTISTSQIRLSAIQATLPTNQGIGAYPCSNFEIIQYKRNYKAI